MTSITLRAKAAYVPVFRLFLADIGYKLAILVENVESSSQVDFSRTLHTAAGTVTSTTGGYYGGVTLLPTLTGIHDKFAGRVCQEGF
jgi:hypothetical protein